MFAKCFQSYRQPQVIENTRTQIMGETAHFLDRSVEGVCCFFDCLWSSATRCSDLTTCKIDGIAYPYEVLRYAVMQFACQPSSFFFLCIDDALC
ncbi:hypothetical protein D9M72_542290 [compost metagenome]